MMTNAQAALIAAASMPSSVSAQNTTLMAGPLKAWLDAQDQAMKPKLKDGDATWGDTA